MSRSNKAALRRLRENAACVFESLHERIYNYTQTHTHTQRRRGTHILHIFIYNI